MKKLLIALVIALLPLNIWSQPRPVQLSNTIIIDTDCGIDDMRAISILLSRPEITIKGVITSEGSLSPTQCTEKVMSLLYEFGRNDIPVARGDVVNGVNPEWRPFVSKTSWGRKTGGSHSPLSGSAYLAEALMNEKGKLAIVCLGSLTNVQKAISKNPGIVSSIDRIIWYNESSIPSQGFNYEIDKESAEAVFRSGVRIDVISNLNAENAFFDLALYNYCIGSETALANSFRYLFKQGPVMSRLKQNHFRLADDLVALYITNPELFGINTDVSKLSVRFNKEYDVMGVREAISDMIKGIYVKEHNVVFNRFPVDREMFNYDVRHIIDTAIARYGADEWKANVMTDEFHGHLGVFSIVGAKMGIKAREIFGVGVDMLDVTTYAGSKPPYSCLTDGIQVSTGATLGMGTIHLAADSVARPSAVFTYNGRSVRLTLKNEYLEKVDSDIDEGILKFGLMDDGYWKLVRNNALKYWLEWDRNKIFNIEEIEK